MMQLDTLRDLVDHVGKDIGTSDWVLIDQALIERFGDVTGDRNWYHMDTERAARELPDGLTIAHGLLTLSLVPGLASQIIKVRNHGRAFNYGLNKVRYPAPVQAGKRVRLNMRVLSAEKAQGGVMLTRAYTMELEGSAKPAMVAEMLTLVL